PRWIAADEEADTGGDDERRDYSPELDARRHTNDERDNLGDPESHQNPEDTAHQRQDARLDEELAQHVCLARAERLADTDLAGPLGDRNQHHVHDDDAGD